MPLNTLIIPDKFKGTLTAHDAADSIASGWRKVRPKDRLALLPMSDGGDGFGEVISSLLHAKRQTVKTLDAAHRPCKANWWWQPKTRTAVIESAKIIGLAMLPPGKFHPFQLDTFGLVAVLRAAVNKGAKRIIIGIGGSATNDGGFGMARASGWQFLNSAGRQIIRWTDLHSLTKISPPKACLFRPGIELVVTVDVQNPLLGKRGATRVYGPQKGLRPKDFKKAESCLRQLAQVCCSGGLRPPVAAVSKDRRSQSAATIPGAGAAGGLGFGLMVFAGAKPQNGFELFAKLSKVSQRLHTADLVITGEGMIDCSSLMGKGAGEIARRCRKLKIPCIGLAGSTDHSHGLNKLFTRVYALTDLTSSQKAKKKAGFWLERLTERVATTNGHEFTRK